MSLTLLRQSLLHVVSLLTPSLLTAQVFIPDPVLRDSLNAQVPGIVDGAGMLDELHPGIGAIDSLVLWHTSSTNLLDLSGLEHLPSLRHLYVTVLDELQQIEEFRIPALPSGVKRLMVNTDLTGLLHIGALPDTMESIVMGYFNDNIPSGNSLVFDELPEYTGYFEISGLRSMNWPGTANCGEFGLTNYYWMDPVTKLTTPPVTTGLLNMYSTDFDSLDLSNVNTTRVVLGDTKVGQWIAWPPATTNLSLYNYSGFESVPSFPALLDTLEAPFSEFCLPYLPNSLRYFSWGGESCLPNWPTDLATAFLTGVAYTESTATYCSILNSDCPGVASSLSGRMVLDLNSNGLADAVEPRVPTSVIHLSSGAMVGPDATGYWEIGVHPGGYTVENSYTHPYVLGVTPSQHDVEVTALGQVHPNNDFAVAVMPNIQDLTAHLVSFTPRPGFSNSVHLTVENFGAVELDALVTFEFDAGQSWVTSSPAPTTMVGNSATWYFPDLQPGHARHMVVRLNTGTTVPLGTPLNYTLRVDPTAMDATPENNQQSIRVVVVGACDPNDKLLSPAVLTPDEVALGETPIEYTIRFQNTGTYHAERVVILDTLSTDLQWESMRFIASSHDQHWYIVDGVLHVVCNEIMLPDSNANEPESHGFFKFSMLPKTDLVNGSTIENIAHIIFDFNAPIITPPAVFMVDVAAGVEAGSTTTALRILPNPAHDRIQLIGDDAKVLPYRIVDLLGQEVQRGTAQPNAWVDVQALAHGSYVLEVTKAGVPTSLRFMKQ
ncbi:MAG: T9SS type A sorting domain-containing protein [Flavobacteriales bacterium]|nr:T9SS type A sorting domain-containing protein [Flavobacteriales bacterium]